MLVFSLLGLLYLSVWFINRHFNSASPSQVTSLAPLPVSAGLPPPGVTAKHVFILDRNSDYVLFQKDADSEIYPASITKIMTAIVAYEHFSLDTVITVDRTYPEGVDISLSPGEKIKVSDLLYALLVPSANDAAEVLASGFPGGREAFVAAMNQQAADMHLRHTHFLNPTGLDQEGHYSSAADLARIADKLLSFPYLAKIVSTENAVISSTDYSTTHSLSNVNQLLGRIDGVVGVKTGFTDLAGQSLVTLVKRDGHEVILSLLGSTDRFGDTEKLINWAFTAFTWSENP